MKSVEVLLNTEDNELISAARNPATTRPLKPTGSTLKISAGNAASVVVRTSPVIGLVTVNKSGYEVTESA